jgi:hypothetical protein
MGAIFTNAPIEPTCTAVQVLSVSFDVLCRYCRHGRRATTYIRPVDAIGSPMIADLYVCAPHADELVARARAKGLAVSIWPPRD